MLLVVDANALVGELLLRARARELFGKDALRPRISEQALDEALPETSRRAARFVERGLAGQKAADVMLDEARGVVEGRISPVPRRSTRASKSGLPHPPDTPTTRRR